MRDPPNLAVSHQGNRNSQTMNGNNTYHNIINVGNRPLKLYSVYAPIKHKPGTIHKTKKEALEEDREDS